ncbi:GATOR complex protein WDR24-like [Zerene cesonia]|uniref:GATOR complex protein WDR24-like n=1 Tax=Zerene cesonia TaxID=33412 RepID=UPI0018E59A7A|nr:GATOR complex protein WDR24-like [Zerene cesonia]
MSINGDVVHVESRFYVSGNGITISDVEKADYDGNEEVSEDYLNDKSGVELLVHERGGRRNQENFNHDSEVEISSLSDRHEMQLNNENEEDDKEEENISQPQKDSPSIYNKRNDELALKSREPVANSNEEDSNFYEDSHQQINDRNEYNDEPLDANRQSILSKHKPFYKKEDLFLKPKTNIKRVGNRDRRQASVDKREKEIIFDFKNNINKKDESEISEDDNESAIKRNIKKLSREELEDLLNSLSDDKKALLKKIIDSKLEGVNKREITKKAGAVEENNILESGQADLSKIDAGRTLDPTISSASIAPGDTTETTKHAEVSSPKNPESDNDSEKNKDELINSNLSLKKEPTVDDEIHIKDSKNDINIKEVPKNENKRETNSDDMPEDKLEMGHDDLLEDTQYSSLGNDMECARDDSWSELMKDESELHKAYKNFNKRDIDNYVNSADIQSLEESFPNYDLVGSKNSESEMAPLVRVKRTNSNLNKRVTDHCMNMKVPFFPRALNDDNDDNEKSEFDDGGIFERASHYENEGKDHGFRELEQNNERIQRSNNNDKNYKAQYKSNYSKIKIDNDNTNIGSDTDNILSNVEGVDDNLMLNNGLRKKRIADNTYLNDEVVNIENNELTPKSAPDFIGAEISNDLTHNSYNAANCQENEAFGPIAHSPDGELSRYKRVRRLKPSPDLKEN